MSLAACADNSAPMAAPALSIADAAKASAAPLRNWDTPAAAPVRDCPAAIAATAAPTSPSADAAASSREGSTRSVDDITLILRSPAHRPTHLFGAAGTVDGHGVLHRRVLEPQHRLPPVVARHRRATTG